MKVSQQYAESIRREVTSRMIDRAGQRKGRLVFLYPTTVGEQFKSAKWIAKCDCGELSLLYPSEKNASSCGCLRAEKSVDAGAKARRKLTTDEVKSIRSGIMNNNACADVFGVCRETIRKIRLRESYMHIK